MPVCTTIKRLSLENVGNLRFFFSVRFNTHTYNVYVRVLSMCVCVCVFDPFFLCSGLVCVFLGCFFRHYPIHFHSSGIQYEYIHVLNMASDLKIGYIYDVIEQTQRINQSTKRLQRKRKKRTACSGFAHILLLAVFLAFRRLSKMVNRLNMFQYNNLAFIQVLIFGSFGHSDCVLLQIAYSHCVIAGDHFTYQSEAILEIIEKASSWPFSFIGRTGQGEWKIVPNQ